MVPDDPKSTVYAIVVKKKRFQITRTLSGAGCPAKLCNSSRKAIISEVTKNPMTILTEVPLRR